MSENLHVVDEKACRGDGLCVTICPKGVLQLREGIARTAPDREQHCIRCGQCVAVCPNECLQMPELDGTEFLPAGRWKPDYEEWLACLHARRSIRVFSSKPVERELVEKVLEACAAAPPAFPPHTTEVVVLDKKQDVEALAAALRAGYAKLLDKWENPIARAVIRMKRGPETVASLRTHGIKVMREDNAWFERNGEDRYLYSAPVVLLFHASRWEAGHEENAMVVATYGMLAAHVLGLGATMLSIVPPSFNNMGKELRPRYGIPEDNKVIVALVMGYPKYRYRRSIRRPLKSVRWL